MRITILVLGAVFLLTQARAQLATENWVQLYDGPQHSTDIPTAIAVDMNGNVFVTGYSNNTNGQPDFATIGYSSAGLPLWTNRYNGSGNKADRAYAIAVDADGSVIVTGSTIKADSFGYYGTIKYSNAGIPLWTNISAGGTAYAIAVSANGDVIVTGNGSYAGSPDYVTIKYSNSGIQLWSTNFNGAGSGSDGASDLAVDFEGNIIVTGNVVAGDGKRDVATIKYSSDGLPIWTNFYRGVGDNGGYATGIALNDLGDVYVAGGSSDSNLVTEFLSLKYSSAGVPLWTNRFRGSPTRNDEATALAVDGVGDCYSVGYEGVGNGISDYLIIKYSSAGVPLWTNRYHGLGNRDDRARAVILDHSGNVIVTGYSHNGTNRDIVTIMYSSQGAALWTNRYNREWTSVANDDRATAMTLDSNGNLFITGTSYYSAEDYATIKYSIGASTHSTRLGFEHFSNQLVLNWTNATLRLQTALTATGTFTNILGATSPYTNAMAAEQQFFRLSDE